MATGERKTLKDIYYPSEYGSWGEFEEYDEDPLEAARPGEMDVRFYPGTGEPAEEVWKTIPQRLESFIEPSESFVRTPEGKVTRDLGEKGEVVHKVDPEIQARMDEPWLAQLDADIATVRNVDPQDPRLSEETRRQVKEAQDRIQAVASAAPRSRPTGMVQLPTEENRENFVNFAIQERFGGVDPRLRNPIEEVRSLGEDYWRDVHERQRRAAGGGGLHWDVMDDKEKEKTLKSMMTFDIDTREIDIKNQVAMLESMIGRYDTDTQRAKAKMEEFVRRGEQEFKEQIKRTREAKESARKAVLSLGSDLTKAQQELAEARTEHLGATDDTRPEIEQRIKDIQTRIEDIRGQLGEARVEATKTEYPQPEQGAPKEKKPAQQAGNLPTQQEIQALIDELTQQYGKKPTRSQLIAEMRSRGMTVDYQNPEP